MAAHCLARYRFPAEPASSISSFLDDHLPSADHHNLLVPDPGAIRALQQLGLTLVYVAIQLPLTIYILESFFARIPADLFDAARMDGYSDWEIFWRVSLPIALPAVATTIILNFILLWNEFLYAVVLITDEGNRTLPLGIQRFIGDRRRTSA